MSWRDLGDWWIGEIEADPAYESVITPMMLGLLRPQPSGLYLDLGAGEGRVMRAVAGRDGRVHGMDISPALALAASASGPLMIGELPKLSFIRDSSYDGLYCVLVFEHVEDQDTLFAEAARVTKLGGVLVLVMNHPQWTAPRSTPITDDDGEILWRPGDYFSAGVTLERAGDKVVVFHHRSLASIVTAAAGAGWSLEEMVEAPHHDLPEQSGIPRLLGCRWRLIR